MRGIGIRLGSPVLAIFPRRRGERPGSRRRLGGRGFCSGTLIETRVVLTAAHCVRAVATGDVPPADIRVNFNPLASGATRAWEPLAYPAAGAALPAGFGEPHAPAGIHVLADPWNDIALLWLAEPAMGIDPAPMADLGYLDDPRVRNDTIAVVGYGLRGFDGSPATPVPGTHIPIRDPAGAGCLPRPLCHDQRRER